MNENNSPRFAPQLYIPNGTKDISFYSKALKAEEHFCWMNDEGFVHVAELSIHGTLFHLHEAKPIAGQLSPAACDGTTVLIGLFVDNVDEYVKNALAAGASLLSPAQDYDYGYRQAEVKDPFGHKWMFEKKI